MNIFKKLVPLSLLILSATGCATAPQGNADIYSINAITYGKVVNIRSFEVEGGVGVGATAGILAGLYSGKGHSTESKLYRAAAGGIAGSLAQRTLTTRTVYEYSLRLFSGKIIQVVSEKSGAMVTDCIEIAYNDAGVQRLERVIGDYCVRIN